MEAKGGEEWEGKGRGKEKGEKKKERKLETCTRVNSAGGRRSLSQDLRVTSEPAWEGNPVIKLLPLVSRASSPPMAPGLTYPFVKTNLTLQRLLLREW